jgi:Cu/Ag efflux pump CusA
LTVLESKAREAAEAVRTVRRAVDVYPEQILGTPYLEIEVDRGAAARYGAIVGDVEDVIEAAIARELRNDLEAVRRVLVPVRSPLGSGMTHVTLAELAAVRLRPGPSMISSENGLLRGASRSSRRSARPGSPPAASARSL